LAHFTVKMCVAVRNHEKITKIPNLRGGGSKSFKVIDSDKIKKPVTSACYDNYIYVLVYNSFHTRRRQNNVFLREYLF